MTKVAKPEFLRGWQTEFKSSIIQSIEQNYKTEILRHYCISDIVPFPNQDKYLVHWIERFATLTDEELTNKYGRTDF